MKRLLSIAALAASAAAATAAAADPVSGMISIGGSDVYTGNSITFTRTGDVGGTSTGSLAVFDHCNDCVTLNGFTFSPFTPTVVFTVSYAGNTASLLLSSITSYAVDDGMGLSIEGTGTLSQTGFDDTSGIFSLTSQNFGNTAANVTFSASAATMGAVPEPAAWAMLIAGFGMVGGTVRVRRRPIASC